MQKNEFLFYVCVSLKYIKYSFIKIEYSSAEFFLQKHVLFCCLKTKNVLKNICFKTSPHIYPEETLITTSD